MRKVSLLFVLFVLSMQVVHAVGVSTVEMYARGSSTAFCRGVVQNVVASTIIERGVCWDQQMQPTVAVHRAISKEVKTSFLTKIEGLSPSTTYYVRAYLITQTGEVYYGEQIEVTTIPRGKMTYSFTWTSNPNVANQAHYDRITAATQTAVDYINEYTSIVKHITVNYNAGVPTAEASYSGYISVGQNASYQQTGTLLHEIDHTIGGGQHALWYQLMVDGRWKGAQANAILQFMTGDATAYVKGDSMHFWPYGINGAQEDDKSDLTYTINVLIAQAFGEDGLPPSGGLATPAKVFDSVNGMRYYLKSEDETKGRLTSFLVDDAGVLVIRALTPNQALSTDAAAWTVAYDAIKRLYVIKNVESGRSLTYNRWREANGMILDTFSDDKPNQYFQIIKGINSTTVGTAVSFETVWSYGIASLTASNGQCLDAYSAVKTGTYDFDHQLNQKWLLLTDSQVKRFNVDGGLPQKEVLSTLLQDQTVLTATQEQVVIQLPFDPVADYSLEVELQIESLSQGRGVDLEARNRAGLGFRFSMDQNALTNTSPFKPPFTPLFTTNSAVQKIRLAVKGDLVYLFCNGEYKDHLKLDTVGTVIDEVSYPLIPRAVGLLSDANQITNPSFAGIGNGASPDNGWLSDGVLGSSKGSKVQVGAAQVPMSVSASRTAFNLKFDNASTYVAYPILLEPNTWYEHSLDLITWGYAYQIPLNVVISSASDGKQGVVYSEQLATSNTPNSAAHKLIRFKTPADLAQVPYYLTYTNTTNTASVGVTNLLFTSNNELNSLLIGKNYKAGDARISLLSVRYEEGAFAPVEGASSVQPLKESVISICTTKTGLSVSNLPASSQISVYTLFGAVVGVYDCTSEGFSIPLSAGFYVVAVKSNTEEVRSKVLVY